MFASKYPRVDSQHIQSREDMEARAAEVLTEKYEKLQFSANSLLNYCWTWIHEQNTEIPNEKIFPVSLTNFNGMLSFGFYADLVWKILRHKRKPPVFTFTDRKCNEELGVVCKKNRLGIIACEIRQVKVRECLYLSI